MNSLLSPEEVIALVQKNYALTDVESCTLIARGFNDHYLIATKNEKTIFRVYLNNKYYVDSFDAYQFELDLLEHLHSNGIPVANPLPRDSGELLGYTDTGHGKRAFALFTYVEGVRLSRDSIFPTQSFQLGKTMAQIHLAANSFNTPLKRYRLDQTYLIDEPLKLIEARTKTSGENANTDERLMRAKHIVEKLQPLNHYIDSLNNINVENDEFGIIHADLHMGNVHFLGNNPKVFDFDHCAYGWRAYDLAIAYYLPTAIRDAMIEGYESVRPLSDSERTSLPDFANLRNLWDIGDIMATETLRDMPQL